MIASVTARKYDTVSKSSVHRITSVGSLNIETLFVATTDIYPTRIAILPLTVNGKAINARKQSINTEFSTSNTSEFSHLYMITLNPDKLAIRPLLPCNRPYKVFQFEKSLN